MTETQIHPMACVDPAADIGEGVEIGPFAVIESDVVIGAGSRIAAHAIVHSGTRMGRDNHIYPGAFMGGDSQDLKWRGEEAYLILGDRNIIREGATLNRATGAGCATRLGDDNLIMAYAHVAHNCVIGNHVVMANAATLAGWVTVEDWAIIGGLTPIHQFCRLGQHCIVGGKAKVTRDIPPFMLADGQPAKPYGLNVRGMKRRGFSPEVISALKRAYRVLYRSHFLLHEAVAHLKREMSDVTEVVTLVRFIEETERGIIRPYPRS